jgi:KRAB domain-containing zinc finger protein
MDRPKNNLILVKHKKDLKIHFRFSHLKEKRYFCDFAECGKTFNSRLHFNDHQLSHSGTPTFSCEDCQKMFFTEFKLKNHRTLHVRAFSCNLCDKRFPKEYKLKQHLRVHSGLRDFSCSYCDNK